MSAAVLLAACGGGDSSDDNKAPERPTLLGVTSGALLDPDAPVDSEVRAMKESGVTTLRAPFYWWTAQPTQLKAPSFAATDPLVAAAARAGIEVLPIVVGSPAWAARHPELRNSPPKGTATYAAFLKTLIAHYGPNGSFWSDHPDLPKQPIEAWQIWNEPDHTHYWSDQPYERDYVALGRAARAAIKQADPHAQVVMAGFADRSWESIAAVYRAGGQGRLRRGGDPPLHL